MDKEAALRKQITEELESEFESRLKQIKRQKEQAQEELESASERWRSEKRRLNSEIDRLEGALTEAKNSKPKHAADSKSAGLDPAGIAKLQEAADEKLKKASQEWDAERARLQSQVNRLEGAVAEAIERSNNPMRATQSVKEQFEVELNRVTKERTELEQAFLRARTEWEQEKLKMTGEMVKLRRAAQIMGKPVPKEDAPEINPTVRDLEKQLKESLAEWNGERERLVQQIQKLEESSRQWDAERRQLNDHAAQLQQAFVQAQAKVQGYEVAARSGTESSAKTEDIRKQAEEIRCGRTILRDRLLVVIHTHHRLKNGVRPAIRHEQLSAAFLEVGQVGVLAQVLEKTSGKPVLRQSSFELIVMLQLFPLLRRHVSFQKDFARIIGLWMKLTGRRKNQETGE